MSSNSDKKRWWEKRLEQKLADGLQNSLEISQRVLKHIPASISAYNAMKAQKIYELDSVVVESAKCEQADSEPTALVSAPGVAPPARAARPVIMPPDLKARALSPEELAKELSERAKTAEKVAVNIDTRHLTLAQLLDPDFCDYT